MAQCGANTLNSMAENCGWLAATWKTWSLADISLDHSVDLVCDRIDMTPRHQQVRDNRRRRRLASHKPDLDFLSAVGLAGIYRTWISWNIHYNVELRWWCYEVHMTNSICHMHFEYEISNEVGVLLNKGETTLVFINMKTNKPCAAPEWFMEKIKAYF